MASSLLARLLLTSIFSGTALLGLLVVGSGLSTRDAGLPALPVLLAPLCLTALTTMGVALARRRARAARRYVRLRVVPYRGEEASPEDVRRFLDAVHQQLLERWWSRLLRGQPSFALEYTTRRDADGQLEARLYIVCPREAVRSVKGSLRACYPDTRTALGAEPDRPVAVVQLRKRHTFMQPLACPEDDFRPNLADGVLAVMSGLPGPATVQIVATPASELFDRIARWAFRAREPGARAQRSELKRHELRVGLTTQHAPLYFADIRVGAQSHAEARAVAGALRGGTVGANRLIPWPVNAATAKRRLLAGTGSPLPNLFGGVLASPELAGLWHLPSPRLPGIRMQRLSVPRVLAGPDVTREPAHALARDELGPVGIRPVDKSDGLGLIGGQKTGKTSLLCRTVQVDAADDDCAVIVLMPKPGDALKALSVVPRHRTVHYLDFEHPELGINPLLARGDPTMVADKIVEAFRDINAEGDIKGSSDRFLRQAAQAALGARAAGVLPGPPSLWDVYRMLLPSEAQFREQVVEALYADPRFTDTVTFFGRDLPNDLRDALVNTTSKLDAPRNKLLRLLVESLDKVLRHPRQLDLDEVVEKREVLIVDGKMGTFGPDNCRVMMQFILNMLYGALQRQQQRPEGERVRVALKVDEAHLIMNESFANALATLRSAGLEVVAAWQYGEQVQDPKVRGGLMSLLRQRCMFSMGESQDAREMSDLTMNVYTDMIRDDPVSRGRVRLAPDTIFNLPNHHAVCSWISHGARSPGFIAQTYPLESDATVIEHHLRAQRDRGGAVPDRLPDPLPDVRVDGRDPAPTAEPVPAGVGAAVDDVDLDFEPAATSISRPNERRPSFRVGVPATYAELDLDAVRGMSWDTVTLTPPDAMPEPTHRELEILATLHRHQFLFSTQIWRRWWAGSTQRASQQGLNRMARAGWVRRFRFLVGERGEQQRVYCLTRAGFELAQKHTGKSGPYVPPSAEWREPAVNDPRRVLRSLHGNAWVLALESVAPKAVGNWRGPGEGRLVPPRRRVRGEWIDLQPRDITVGSSRRVHGLQADRFEPVRPDATVELRLALPDGSRRFDLLVEAERARGGRAREDKLRRYDALLTGWCRLLERYKTLKTPPVVVFVCEDEKAAKAYARLADGLVTGQVAKAGTEAPEWPYPGRRTMFFAAERDIHEGSLEAWQLPELAPDLRMKLGTGDGRTVPLRRVAIVDPRLLGLS